MHLGCLLASVGGGATGAARTIGTYRSVARSHYPEVRDEGAEYHRVVTSLDLALLYLVAAVLGVVVCRSLKLPPMLGYLAVGVLIGPNALAFAHDSASINYLAEFGVVFLMFAIGLEFNLPKLRALRTAVFGHRHGPGGADHRRRAGRQCAC